MTKATELESRGNVSTLFTGCAQIYHQRWYICTLSEGQVSLAWTPAEGIVCLTTAKRGNDNSLSQAALALCVQTKAKVRFLSAHKVYPCAPLPYRQNVDVAYG